MTIPECVSSLTISMKPGCVLFKYDETLAIPREEIKYVKKLIIDINS